MRLAAGAWLLVVPTALWSQEPDAFALRGWVLDGYSSFPVARTRVVVTAGADTLAETQTDGAGWFEVGVPTSSVTVHFVRLGYRADSLRHEVTELPLRVAMNPLQAPAVLAAVTIRGPVSAFERRMRRGSAGRFISPERITEANVRQTADLLRNFAGIQLHDSLGSIIALGQRSVRVRPNTNNPGEQAPDREAQVTQSSDENCPMRVGVNGSIMMRGFSLNEVHVAELYGIEVYVGVASIPAEYAGIANDAQCGLIMIWTKAARERERAKEPER